jgi:hypothetical protein
LNKWTGAEPPRPTNNLLRALVNYTRYMQTQAEERQELTSIPALTVEKLKNDPYFKYVFSRVMYHRDVYKPESWLGKSVREVLDKAISDPASVSEESLYKGIQLYIGNFMHNMPRGLYHTSLEYLLKKTGIKPETNEAAAEQEKRNQLFQLINKILEGKVLSETFNFVLADKNREGWGNYEKHLEYVKIGLEVFQTLTNKYNYDPEYLAQ